ncbi:hypothetical protein [Streptomyces sp. st77]|uniref:hypothetical protein n=1 Tax=Streptomyces sp. st77 TaxID=1828074 RepID=UPI000BFDA457|nr:hypothetical protein [Streptomyces sp. st77]
MDVWNYFEGKPEIFAAVVALLVGVGAILGAKIQANGGRAQAAAAREAARIAAKAQQEAALWTVRQVQTAEYIQRVRDVRRISTLLFEQDPEADNLLAQLVSASQAANQKLAEVQLIAHSSTVNAAEMVNDALMEVVEISYLLGPGLYGYGVIFDESFSPEPPDSATANNALNSLMELRRAHEEGSDDQTMSRLRRHARLDVLQVDGITPKIAQSLLLSAEMPDGEREKERRNAELEERMRSLISTAREMLRSEGNVAPVPAPRRWWQRAAT